MALGPSQTTWKKTIPVLGAAQMSHALVGLTTDLALTLTVQAIPVGPSSQFRCGGTYLQEGQIVQDVHYLKYVVLLFHKPWKYSGNPDLSVSSA